MLRPIAVLSITALALAACGSLDTSKANVRFVHASPDAGAVDLFINGSKVAAGYGYTQFSGYTGFVQGNLAVKVCPASASTTPPAGCPIDTSFKADPGKSYTVVAVGSLAGGGLEALVAPDDPTAPTVAGQSKLRVIHAAPAATPVDVYMTTPTADITSVSATIPNLAYKAITAPYLGINADSYRFRITAAGTKNVLIDSGTTGFPLASGKIYTAIAVNPSAGVTNGLILLFDK